MFAIMLISKTTYLPNIHTSLEDVKRLKLIDSGAIHLIGSFPLEATDRENTLYTTCECAKVSLIFETIHF